MHLRTEISMSEINFLTNHLTKLILLGEMKLILHGEMNLILI